MRRLLPLVLFLVLWVPAAHAWTWPVDGRGRAGLRVRPRAPVRGRASTAASTSPRRRPGPVLAPASGTVTFAGSVADERRARSRSRPPTALAVTLTHLGSIAVAKGDTVAEGDDDRHGRPDRHARGRRAVRPSRDPARRRPERLPRPALACCRWRRPRPPPIRAVAGTGSGRIRRHPAASAGDAHARSGPARRPAPADLRADRPTVRPADSRRSGRSACAGRTFRRRGASGRSACLRLRPIRLPCGSRRRPPESADANAGALRPRYSPLHRSQRRSLPLSAASVAPSRPPVRLPTATAAEPTVPDPRPAEPSGWLAPEAARRASAAAAARDADTAELARGARAAPVRRRPRRTGRRPRRRTRRSRRHRSLAPRRACRRRSARRSRRGRAGRCPRRAR